MKRKVSKADIYTGVGIAGMVATTILAVRSTPKAVQCINREKREKKVEKLALKDTIRVSYKYYIPSILLGGISIWCLIESRNVGIRNQMALATAYTVSRDAFREYKSNLKQELGEERYSEIEQKIQKSKALKADSGTLVISGNDIICYDSFSGRVFASTMNDIERIVNNINKRLRDEMTVSLNELYYEIGLDSIKSGELLGWDIESGYLEVSYDSMIDDKGKPILVIEYDCVPLQD